MKRTYLVADLVGLTLANLLLSGVTEVMYLTGISSSPRLPIMFFLIAVICSGPIFYKAVDKKKEAEMSE